MPATVEVLPPVTTAPEEVERKRQEALRPDKEKLHVLAESIASMSLPKLALPRSIDARLREIVVRAADQIREIAASL